jgi:hypothetical protein
VGFIVFVVVAVLSKQKHAWLMENRDEQKKICNFFEAVFLVQTQKSDVKMLSIVFCLSIEFVYTKRINKKNV